MRTATVATQPGPTGQEPSDEHQLQQNPQPPVGLLEPDAWKAGSSGSEGAGAQQCAPATRGFHHRLVRGRTPKSAQLTFLARWPARKATQRARDRIREITGRKWLWMPVEDIVRDLNLFLRGWAGYFRYGNSARVLGQIRNYALQRLAIWLSKQGNRRRAWRWGLKQLLLSPNRMGLISLDGTVVAPRPFRDWRGKAEHRR